MEVISEIEVMEIKDYCKYVERELLLWQEKLNNIVNQMDNVSTGAKQGMYQEVNGLHIILEEMNERIQKLRSECPVSWKPQREDMTPTLPGMKRSSSVADSH